MTWKAVVKRNAATTHLAAINKSLRNTKKKEAVKFPETNFVSN